MTDDAAAAYLAGMIDGEGTVTKPPKRDGGARCIIITNTNYALIEACVECATQLGLYFRIHECTAPSRRQYRTCWSFVIAKYKSLEIVWARVPIRAPEKRKKLRTLLDSYKRTPYTHPTRDLLHQLYVVEGKGYEEIRQLTGARSHGTVGWWLKKHGIEKTRKNRSTRL